mmetsp:Transcript_32231/g.53269  ORF Transcript_32231/g.53269 Transcript_32231/m.53269 type:complete len:87 (-) Transcript_32231:17-277(-)
MISQPSHHVLTCTDNPWTIGYWGDLWSVRCNFCPDNSMLASTHNYPEWESSFCACLQDTSDGVLQTASNCHIERENESIATSVREA